MKSQKKITIRILVLTTLFFASAYGNALADEKIGTLVFNAMSKIHDTQKGFLDDVEKIKAKRKNAITEREAVKKQYEKAKDGSLDKREFHARFSLTQAKVYRALHDEAKLTNKVAGKQLRILSKLNDSVISSGAEMSNKKNMSVVEATKPFLENGKSLLLSLAKYRHKITDPSINSKLNAAYDTAHMLSKYMKHIERGKTSKYASQMVLKKELSELIEQLNALYVQTDIFMSMIKDKTTVLKMINELAASEAAIWAISDGRKSIERLSSDVISQMMDILNESDEDLASLVSGVLGDNQRVDTAPGSQKWTNPNF